MDRRDFLEISPYQADGGELIGRRPNEVSPRDSLPEIQGAESSEGHSREVHRLLLWGHFRGSQVRRGGLCPVALPHGHEPLSEEENTLTRGETRTVRAAPKGGCHMTQKIKGPAMAATMDRPDSRIDEQAPTNSKDTSWQGPPQADFEQRIHELEVIVEWRDELTIRIARETLIFEFADCTRGEEFEALEAEVSLFNQVCCAITGTTPESEAV